MLKKVSLVYKVLVISVVLWFNDFVFCQPDYQLPVKIPVSLSANFGELRTNHFHTGIDIKTQGRNGIPLYAIADGYISRINISYYGYGFALYINHPDGNTSVYAHMSKFIDTIKNFAFIAQKYIESETIEIYPGKFQIPVKKGQLIGWSGNSGHSFGPHLHFEIRNTKSEKPINPLLFYKSVKDKTPPTIQGIKIYSISDDNKRVGEWEKYYSVIKKSEGYSMKDEIKAKGKIGIGVSVYDKFDNAPNKCAPYGLRLYKGNELIYEHKIDTLDFYTSRFINQHKDYHAFHEERKWIEKCFVLGNNQLDIYHNLSNNGVVNIEKDENFRIEVYDLKNNKSTFNFAVKYSPVIPDDRGVGGTLHSYEKEFIHKDDSLEIKIPTKSLYYDEYIPIKNLGKNSYASKYKIGFESTPIQKYFSLKLKTTSTKDSSKLCIVKYKTDESFYSIGGKYKNGWMEIKNRDFGIFGVMLDTTAPNIKIVDSKIKEYFNIELSDNLSGLKWFKVYANGKWILSNYNRRKGILSFKVPKNINVILVKVSDNVGNINSEELKVN